MKRFVLAFAVCAAPLSAHATNPVIDHPVQWAEKMVCYVMGKNIAYQATKNSPLWTLKDGDGSWNLASGYWTTRQGDVQDIASWGENAPKNTEAVRAAVRDVWSPVCSAVVKGLALPAPPRVNAN